MEQCRAVLAHLLLRSVVVRHPIIPLPSMSATIGPRLRGQSSRIRLVCCSRRVLSCVSLAVASILVLLCAQVLLSLRSVGVMSLWPALLTARISDGSSDSELRSLARTTLRRLPPTEYEGRTSRLHPIAVPPPARGTASSNASILQLVSHWAVVGGSADVTSELLSVHWTTIDHDGCPDLFVVTSASPVIPSEPITAAGPYSNLSTAAVSVSRLMGRSCNQSSASNSKVAAAATRGQQSAESDDAFVTGLGVHVLAEAGSALAALSVDVDGDYYMDLVLAAEMRQRADNGSSSSDRSFVCGVSGNQSHVSRMLLPRGSVMVREMGLAPEAALDAAADSTAVRTGEEEVEAEVRRSVNVGLPMVAVDWNLDGTLDFLHAHSDGETLYYRSLATLRSADGLCTGECSELLVQRDVFQPSSANIFPCTVTLLALVDADLQPELVCFGSAFPRKLRILRYTHQKDFMQDWTWRFRPVPVPNRDVAPAKMRHSLFDACMADFNGDGVADYVLATHRQGVVVWLSAPDLAPIPPPKPPATLPAMLVPGYTVHFVSPPWAQQWQGGQRSDTHTALSVACVDIDNDRDFDVVVLYETSGATDEQRGSAIFLNDGNSGRMKFAGPLVGAGSSGRTSERGREVARGASLAIADYNADGRMDVLAASSAGFQLFRNQGLTMNATGQLQKPQAWRQHWLTISLWGVQVSNSFAVGAVVQIIGNSGRLRLSQTVQMPSAAVQPYAQHHHVLHFGLGNCSMLEYIVVHWPRARQGHARNLLRYESVVADQHLHILQLNAGELTLPSNLRSRLAGYHFKQSKCARPGTQRLRPSFFIIGQFKGGTSSLAASLRSHPKIKPASMKELHYFSHLASDLSLAWYLQHFPCGSSTDHTFEASASYFGSLTAPSSLLATFPAAKLILLLRDPVTRAFSHYRMMFVRAVELQPTTVDANGIAVPVDDFCEAVSLELALFRMCVKQHSPAYKGKAEQLTSELMARNDVVPFAALSACYNDSNNSTNYVRAGLYEVMLRVWWQALGEARRGQLLVVASETFRKEPAAVIKRVHQFVGIEPLEEGQYLRENEGVAANMSVAARDMLRDFYRPFNQRLAALKTFSDGKRPNWIDYSVDD